MRYFSYMRRVSQWLALTVVFSCVLVSAFAQSGSGVQFQLVGDFTGDFTFLNDIPASGLDIDANDTTDIIPPCSCREAEIIPNGTNSDNGFFDDQLIVATGTSGQVWTLVNPQNILSSIDLSPLLEGAVFTEIGSTGIYVLKFAHSEALPYIAEVEGPGGSFGPIANQCFYPDPEIINLDTFYCDDAANISLFGITTSPFDGNLDWLPAVNDLWFITRLEDSTYQFSSVFSPGTLGEGTYNVKYIYDAGYPLENANRTGCKRTAEMTVTVQAAYPMVCHSNLSTSIGNNSCEAVLTPATLLVGTPEHPENFTIDVVTDEGINIGPILTADYVGQHLTAIITDNCNGAFCTSEIALFDYAAPVLTIPDDRIISCLADSSPANTGFATAVDCQAATVSYTDEWVDLDCVSSLYSARINRDWLAIDASGNQTTGQQQIFIRMGRSADLIFPNDTTFTCSEWLLNPDITNGTSTGSGSPNLPMFGNCKIVASFSDDTLPYCGNAETSFIIFRNWTVINLCTNEILTTDALGNDNIQFITVRDVEAPDIVTQPLELMAGMDTCTAVGLVPPPVLFDDCNEVTIRIFSPIGELDYVDGQDGASGGYLPAPGLGVGRYVLAYEATDACGNTLTVEDSLRVIDNLSPTVLCNSSLTVILPTNGNGVLFATSIDEGSRDNCCLVDALIKRSGEPDSDFRPFIEFYCDNDTIEVILRVTDCYGNYNECSSQVLVLDNSPAYVVEVAADEFFICESDISAYQTEDFHAPVFGDNCSFEVIYSDTLMVNDCGIGRLLRRWEARDNDRNEPAIATQSIWLQPNHDYEIIIPADTVMTCPLFSFNDVQLKSFGCDLMSASVSFDTLITNTNGLCMTINRTYYIVNWCEYDGESEAMELFRLVDDGTGLAQGYSIHSDGEILLRSVMGSELPVGVSTGFYSYHQQVHIVDDEPPVLTLQTEPDFCLDADCKAMVQLEFLVADNCTALPFVQYKIKNDAGVFVDDTTGILVNMGDNQYQISGLFEVGFYEFEVEMRDNCGGVGRAVIMANVIDCIPPEISCISGVSVDLDEDGFYSVTVSSLVMSAEDDCGMVSLSFEQDSLMETKKYDCADVGIDSLWIWATDEGGNQNSCLVLVEVRDTSLYCFDFYDIGGRVLLDNGDGIDSVDIRLFGEVVSSTTTNANGDYLLEEIIEGDTYQLLASKEDTYINGVTTFDIIRIQRHILGTLPLVNPYKILAADVNDSGIISTLDIIQLRKLILGINTFIPNRSSPWFFIPADYQFTDALHPLQDDFPRQITIAPLDSSRTLDFIGIKVGDLNNSVTF